MPDFEIFSGSSIGPVPVRPAIDDDVSVIDGHWQCKTALVNEVGEVVVASRIESLKSADNLNFLVSLSAEDTAQAVFGDYSIYYWVIQVSNNNLIPGYRNEQQLKIHIKRSGMIT